MSAKHGSPSVRAPPRAAKRVKAAARCADCKEWVRRADEVAEREAALVVKEPSLVNGHLDEGSPSGVFNGKKKNV